MYLGEFGFDDKHKTKIATTDMQNFTFDNIGVVQRSDSENLNQYAVFLNSPWSATNIQYTIEFNCTDNWFEEYTPNVEYRCCYEVTGYDGCFSNIYGYGNSKIEALTNCIEHFDYIQEVYNSQNESF